MARRTSGLIALLILACLPGSHAFAQFGGSRAGLEEHSRGIPNLPQLDREIVEGFIAIDGRAELRVRPTEIRVVLAVTSEGASALTSGKADLDDFLRIFRPRASISRGRQPRPSRVDHEPVNLGCDFGSTTAKAVVLSSEGELLHDCYIMSKGNPIEDAKSILGRIRAAGYERISGLAITGYGKDLSMYGLEDYTVVRHVLISHN